MTIEDTKKTHNMAVFVVVWVTSIMQSIGAGKLLMRHLFKHLNYVTTIEHTKTFSPLVHWPTC